ncbi:MAG: DUF6232 family protein [Acidobacteriota bacterium]
MSEERIFLNEGNLYVSNTKVVLHGTTYATAHITSVSKRITPAKRGCSVLLIVLGVSSLFAALVTGMATKMDSEVTMDVLIGASMFAIGVLWFRSAKATYHLVLSLASGEREALSSPDEALVDRVAAAIADAITHRS